VNNKLQYKEKITTTVVTSTS